MRLLLIAFLLVSVALSGCSNVKTYTFKKDRVDQRLQEGNRGYVQGEVPPAPAVTEVPKRTMIGVDVEIGLLPHEKAKVSQKETAVTEAVAEEEVAVVEEVSAPDETPEQVTPNSEPEEPVSVAEEAAFPESSAQTEATVIVDEDEVFIK